MLVNATMPGLSAHPAAKANPNTTFLHALFFLLTGYATANKGFAYIGISPIFIGDAILVYGLLVLLRTADIVALLRDRCLLSVLAFMLWGAFRTIPFVPQYGVDALRDAVTWGYGVFAFTVASAMLSDWSQPARVTRFFQLFAVIFLVFFPFAFVLTEIYGDAMPTWPGTAVTLIELKIPHALVHLAGISALLLAGLVDLGNVSRLGLTIFVLVCAARARSGFVAYMGAMALIGALAPVRRYLLLFVAIMLAGYAVLAVTDIRVKLTDDRELSAEAISKGLGAVTAFTELGNYRHAKALLQTAGRMDSTVIWRAAWAAFLVDRVSQEAPLTGVGHGMTLALPGVPVGTGEARSPHNGFVTIYARMGLIGFGLWMAMLIIWFHAMLSSHLNAVRNRKFIWASLFMALPAYVVAILINSALDVFLEGPMGGIWFWSLIGMGAAFRRWYISAPDYWERVAA